MSNVPEARHRIQHLINCLQDGYPFSPEQLIENLSDILPLLHRKMPIRRADPHSQPMTPELAAAIRAFAKRNEGMPLQTIGQRFNVNAGRVTEVLQAEQERSA
jgi:hypothetical protein